MAGSLPFPRTLNERGYFSRLNEFILDVNSVLNRGYFWLVSRERS
jgi:hypothetical protein